jgi:hypothetical protein
MMKIQCLSTAMLASVLGAVSYPVSVTANEQADLAQDLNNPLAELITVPVQMNYDSDNGVKSSLIQLDCDPRLKL